MKELCLTGELIGHVQFEALNCMPKNITLLTEQIATNHFERKQKIQRGQYWGMEALYLISVTLNLHIGWLLWKSSCSYASLQMVHLDFICLCLFSLRSSENNQLNEYSYIVAGFCSLPFSYWDIMITKLSIFTMINFSISLS